MSDTITRQLGELEQGLDAAVILCTPEMNDLLERLRSVAESFDSSWSGSAVGYHANVYYEGFQSPPPGCHFSAAWGLMDLAFVKGSTGSWREYAADEVREEIFNGAGNPDLAQIESASSTVSDIFRNGQSTFESLISLISGNSKNTYIETLLSQATHLRILSFEEAVAMQLPRGTLISRDEKAISGGVKIAPHQSVIATIVALKMPFKQCQELSRLCKLANSHLKIDDPSPPMTNRRSGKRVFIGHGQSHEWRKIEDYLSNQLGLECDEFNRIPVSGVSNTSRLVSMLNEAEIAIIVMTAEDEDANGRTRARENVIHEAGLFQGRLGFEKTIVMADEKCNIFSNIDGLGRIQFVEGRIEETFVELRRILVREGVIR